MERPWFEAWPGGEDNYFYAKLSRLKIPAFVDHALSWETGHIGEHVFTNADTVVADEERWTPGEGIASS